MFQWCHNLMWQPEASLYSLWYFELLSRLTHCNCCEINAFINTANLAILRLVCIFVKQYSKEFHAIPEETNGKSWNFRLESM